MDTRSVANSPDRPPASALDLVGAGAGESAPDPGAARDALTGAGDRQDAATEGPSARDRAHRPGSRRAGRKGGHKATKAELERETKELRQQLASAAPDAVAVVESTAGQIAPALGATFQTAFGMVARKRGAHWQLDPSEKEMLANHWAIALAPYMREAGPYVPWAAAVMVTWGVVEGRVEQDARRLAPASS